MNDVRFGFGMTFTNGRDPSVGLDRGGNVVLVHGTASGEKHYRVGRLNQASIDWGPERAGGLGLRPRIALNNQGVAVEVHKNQREGILYCRAGRLDAAGSDVRWPHADRYAEGGNRDRPSVALNDAGVVVAAHEVDKGRQGMWVYYDVGQVREAGGTHRIHWSQRQVQHGRGGMPGLAIDGRGRVVEVRRVDARWLQYSISHVRGNRIELGPVRQIVLPGNVRGNGHYPSVAITEDGLVIVVIRALRPIDVHELAGRISADGRSITWHRWRYIDDGTVPSVAAAGTMAVEAHQHERNQELRFSTSLITDRARWMERRLGTLGRKRLGDLVLPASHDAGMYKAAIPALARNQSLSIHEQLRYGIRYFDLRPMWGFAGRGPWLIHHGGIPGPSVQTVLNDVRRFATEAQEGKVHELVILTLSSFRYVDNNSYRTLTRQITDTLGPWLVRSKPRTRFADVTLGELVKNGPAVLVVVDRDFAIHNPVEGIWVYRDWHRTEPGDLCVHDSFSGTEHFERMRNDQLDKFEAFAGHMRDHPALPCDLFLLSWTLTPPSSTPGRPIPPNPWMLARRANPTLGHDVRLGSSRPSIPNRHGKVVNLVYVDYVETARVTDVALFLNGERATAAAEKPPQRRAKAATRTKKTARSRASAKAKP
ncbi:MAG: hypothetical protein ABW221_27810 [Vicinamibacteria bacterium]